MFDFNATLTVAIISFVVFMFIMNAILYRPVLNIIRKRDDFVNQNYEDAKNLAQKAKNISDEYQTKLSGAKEQSRNKIAQELETVQKLSFEQTQNAKEQAKIQIQNNKNLIDAKKNELYEVIDSGMTDEISSEILNKLVG